jgi:hypothetical protein
MLHSRIRPGVERRRFQIDGGGWGRSNNDAAATIRLMLRAGKSYLTERIMPQHCGRVQAAGAWRMSLERATLMLSGAFQQRPPWLDLSQPLRVVPRLSMFVQIAPA